MFRAQRFFPIAAATFLAVAPWLWRGKPAATPVDLDRPLRPAACYAIPAVGDFATFDVPAEHGARYVLIVSSLGEASQPCTVRLTSRIVPEARLVPTQAIEPLSRTRFTSPAPAGAGRTAAESPRPKLPPEAPMRDFHLHVTDGDLADPQQYACVAAVLAAEGADVRVWLDSQVRPDQLHAGLLEEIVRSFDDMVLPTSRRLLGDYRDVDGDGRFSILVSPWLDRLQGGRTSLGGMARGSDFRPDLEPPLSNRSDLLYLNANLRPNDHLRTLLAHEFAHALCFSRRIAADGAGGLPAEEDWLTEAIAHLSEDLHGCGWSNLDHRVARFLDEPHTAPLVVDDYYRAGLWRDPGCRGATYLFLRWCVDHFGEALLAQLAAAPGRGTANLETVTGIPFPELYRRWTAALLLSGRTVRVSSRPCEFDEYRAIDLFGRLGTRQLAGPHLTEWQAGGEPCELSLRGTSSAFVMLPAAGGEPRRVSVQADPGTRLQVSLVRLDPSTPELQIARDPSRTDRDSQ